jgi:uncharacterized protein
VAQHITFVGSVTWQQERPFDVHDLARLGVHRSRLPGADESTPLVAVSRTGATMDGVILIGPDELVAAGR